MENIFKVYDVYENNYKLNSQVIFNNIGFEIPDNYYFDKNETNFAENRFKILNENYNAIYINCGITDENNFKIAVERLNNPKYEFYINYRCQKIYEYKENEYIRIIAYIDNIFCDLYCRCKKYTQEYYDLCYIAFSFCKLSNSIYDDLFIQKNNYCILKNGKYIFDSYSINLNFKNPYRFLTKLNDVQFKEYLTKNKKIDQGLSNPYLDNGFEKIFNKIENYKNSNINDIAGITIEIISDYENEVYENE